jgi:cytochrome c oxidase subunit 4
MEHVQTPEEIKRSVRKYIMVFIALLALTLLTVTASELNLGITETIIIGLFIASVKGSLVAIYFMHLISERKFIYFVLVLTVIFFAVLMTLPLFAHSNPITNHVA